MSPAPPDPVQARMMQIMPVVFAVLLLFFPAGLVAYQLTNTVLSILQQWRINTIVVARVGGHVTRSALEESTLGMRRDDTIAALATAPGVGAIAVVRLSGPRHTPSLVR